MADARPISRRLPRALARAGAVVAALVLLAWGAVEIGVRSVEPLAMERAESTSPTVLDRNGALLRAYTTADDRWRLPLEPADVDPIYLRMLLAFEDRRFYSHHGVDPFATLRAIGQFVRHGRIVSGSSTLSMQVARLLDGQHDRDAVGKVRQMLRAIALERARSKTEILRLYLTLAPFGGNLEGVRAAALAYFGSEPRHLSPAEAALLVAIPQAPESRKPERFPQAARRARDRVLDRAVASGVLSVDDASRARREPLPSVRRDFPRLAAHLADAERTADPSQSILRLTIEGKLQTSLEALARTHAHATGEGLSAAIVAVDIASGEIVASVGSSGLFDDARGGAVDMTRAVRSPGSTLKPFIYGLAFEAGLAHPNTLIDDRPTQFGTYAPKNFDHDWHGTVTIREALAQSLNIPAVAVLEAVGPQRFYARLREARVDPQLPKDAEPTLAMALGGVGVRLVDLAGLYASLARGGETIALKVRRDAAKAGADERPPGRLMSAVAAWYVTDILRHAPPPANAKGGQIAFKTGTSYGGRDAWAVGYDGRNAIAVWVGRPDGGAVAGLAGRASAAPLLFDAFERVAAERASLPPAPPGVLMATGPDLPPPLRRFGALAEATAGGAFRIAPLHIVSPPDRAEVDVAASDGVTVKADGGQLPLTWLIDGAPVATSAGRRELDLPPQARGFVKVSVIDATGRTDRITVRIR